MSETKPKVVRCPRCGAVGAYRLYEVADNCGCKGEHRTECAIDIDEEICMDSPTGNYRCHWEGGCGEEFSEAEVVHNDVVAQADQVAGQVMSSGQRGEQISALLTSNAWLCNEVDRLCARLALRDKQIERVRKIVHEFRTEMWANVPLSPPDPDLDPNDEFKRCAVDRAERTNRFEAKVTAALATDQEA